MMADLAIRVDHIEEHVKEDRGRLDEAEGRLDTQSEAVDRITRWALLGNGDSAEIRLAKVENRIEVIPEMQETLRIVRLIADAKLQNITEAVTSVLDEREKTIIAKVKAWAPIASAAIAAIAVILVAVFK
jgi:hypothetical protein